MTKQEALVNNDAMNEAINEAADALFIASMQAFREVTGQEFEPDGEELGDLREMRRIVNLH